MNQQREQQRNGAAPAIAGGELDYPLSEFLRFTRRALAPPFRKCERSERGPWHRGWFLLRNFLWTFSKTIMPRFASARSVKAARARTQALGLFFQRSLRQNKNIN
ncbi:MAG: hypothetical protein FJY56_06015 [Betaproteobacteria bacterium]|nr:hypothetical protein [Betaproteobacteria bacterium]